MCFSHVLFTECVLSTCQWHTFMKTCRNLNVFWRQELNKTQNTAISIGIVTFIMILLSNEFLNFTLLLVYPQHKPFGRTDVSWNLDGTVLALGNEDGWVFWYMIFRLRYILFRSKINTSSSGDEIIFKFTVYKTETIPDAHLWWRFKSVKT